MVLKETFLFLWGSEAGKMQIQLSVAMFLIVHICNSNVLHLNALCFYPFPSELIYLMNFGCRNCLSIKKSKTPALSISTAFSQVLRLRVCQRQGSDLNFKLGVSDTKGGPGRTRLHLCGKVMEADARLTSTCSKGRGAQGGLSVRCQQGQLWKSAHGHLGRCSWQGGLKSGFAILSEILGAA